MIYEERNMSVVCELKNLSFDKYDSDQIPCGVQ